MAEISAQPDDDVLRLRVDRSPGRAIIRAKRRLPATAHLPDSFVPDFVEHLDMRSRTARALVRRIRDIEAHSYGGSPAAPLKRSLIRRYVWLETLAESTEVNIARGDLIDVGSYTQLVFALAQLSRMIGTDMRYVRGKADPRYTVAPRTLAPAPDSRPGVSRIPSPG